MSAAPNFRARIYALALILAVLAAIFSCGIATSAQTPGPLNLTIEQGADFSITLTVKDSAGVVVNLTGYTFAAQFRQTYASTSPIATFTCTCTVPASGQIVLSMPNATTGALTAPQSGVWDLFLTDASLNKIRLLAGSVTVAPRVTR